MRSSPDGRAPRPGLLQARTFAALRHRDFRLFWAGLLLSLTGGWMQQVAAPWLVYRLTDSAWALGLVGFVAALPAVPLALIAGPLIDRLPRRRVLLATQVGLLLPAIALAVVVWTGQVQVWHVVAAELVRGMAAAFDQPAKQVAIVEMTGAEDVGSAIALWNAAINVARIAGPLAASAAIAWGGEGWCFFLNGLSYLAVVLALVFIRLPAVEPGARRTSLAGGIVEGLRYIAARHWLIGAMALVFAAGFLVRPFQTLLAVFVRDILLAGPAELGVLTAAAGLGAVIGAIAAASVPAGRQRGFLLVTALLLPIATAAFAVSRSYALSFGLLIGVGACLVALETSGNALLLSEVKEEFRGRVMSLFSLGSMGAPRLGGLQAGWVASRWGAPLALGLDAACMLFCVALPAAALLGRRRGALDAGRDQGSLP